MTAAASPAIFTTAYAMASQHDRLRWRTKSIWPLCVAGRFFAMLRPLPGEAQIEAFARRADEQAAHQRQNPRASQQIKNSRVLGLRAFHLLELEFIRPGNDRSPDELVHGHDHADHRDQAPDNRARVARRLPPFASRNPDQGCGNPACSERTSRRRSDKTRRSPRRSSNSRPVRWRKTAAPFAASFCHGLQR